MTVQIIPGDCRAILPTLAGASVQCCVTSPPYYGLRDYGTAAWEGGNNSACDHSRSVWDGPKQTQGAQSGHASKADRLGRRECIKCGATRTDRQIGLEPTPDEYVAEMVAVFREVRRVLRDDGTLWLNIGDSYASAPPGNKTVGVSAKSGLNGVNGASGKYRETLAAGHQTKRDTSRLEGIKPKDLLGIPWLLAFALRADGWFLRSDIIWHKPNPMPESVRDRPTSAHEHVFLLSKRDRYFYDADAIAEGLEPSSLARLAQNLSGQKGSERAHAGGKTNGPMKAVAPKVRGIPPRHQGLSSSDQSGLDTVGRGEGRNARNVWTIATQPFSGAHFATMPPDLAERCIKAGTKPGDTVLDPFGGAGTTGLVADRLGRNAVLIELNPAYRTLAANRLHDDAPLLVVAS